MADDQIEGLSARWRRATGAGPIDGHPTRLGPLVRQISEKARSSNVIPRRWRGFPFTRPTWPGTVPHESGPSTLGTDYDTEWARSPAARAARRAIMLGLLRPTVRALADPTVEGLDRIEHLDGPIVFAANHHSHLDIMLLLSSIPTKLRSKTVVAAAGDYFFDKRWKAAGAALALGAIPIERRRVSRTSAYQAQALLADGWNVVIFPEGGRSPDGWGQEFKPGAAFLAIRENCPVVPVHIEGTDRVLPKGASRPRRDHTTVTFGHPLHAVDGEDARRFGPRIERAVAELADEATTDWWQARRRAAQDLTPPLSGPGEVAPWRRKWALGTKQKAQDTPKNRWPRTD